MIGFRPEDVDRIAANVDVGKYATRTGLHAGERNNPCSPAFVSISNPSPRQGSAGARLWPALDPITRFCTEAQKELTNDL
jgi:hypothetical protein